ncbi:MAG: tRNA 2-thiouridine(34) synthase MnmA [Planctomycetota bacterium]|nr:tRNA 2-thiouridine(34) synthase MnmA [Planctomycetota bacterium]MDA1250467.1 tRNA 2-thiouridine(34) synthase MnmA [Planctomycetota bacterium]
MPRVVLAMSGGVDSSAAAVLLQEQGYDVIGLFMRSGATEEQTCATGVGANSAGASDFRLPVVSAKPNKQGCCSASDAADARRVADMLDIPFHALNFKDAFGRIKDYFADEYLAGRTPNPCVMCNNWLKFGKLWDFARQVGAEFIASGHYARIGAGNGNAFRECEAPAEPARVTSAGTLLATDPTLKRGLDGSKDQSYVLFGINRDLLNRVIFPVGDFEKPLIRDKALQAGLRVFDKPDSQEICFIPDNDYAGFIERFRGVQETAGDFVDTSGNVLGQHPGYEKFTIGQRRGIGIAFGEPRYVVGLKPDSRQVVIGTKDELGRATLTADRTNWLVENVPAKFRCLAQIRYRHIAAPCEVTVTDEDRFHVEFDEPQSAVAPGQAVVLYEGDRVLGGGWIC